MLKIKRKDPNFNDVHEMGHDCVYVTCYKHECYLSGKQHWSCNVNGLLQQTVLESFINISLQFIFT